MAQFSLSPAVTIREVNLTGYVPNIPSAKTGAILRADQGPCLDVTPLTNENDLVSTFGKPTAANFQDWFQCWNFLQYSSSLYVVRPMSSNVKSAGISLTGTGTPSLASQKGFYNRIVAEKTLSNLTSTDSLVFINKDVTSNQRIAVGVCSTPQYYKSPIGLEFYANVSTTTGANVVSANECTLVNGSQVVLNGNKLATVTSVNQTGATASTINFDRPVSSVDVAPFYGVSNVLVSSAVVSGGSVVAQFKKDGFTFKLGTVVNTDFVVSGISNNASDNTLYDVAFYNTNLAATTTFTVSAGTAYYGGNIKYFGKTAYNVSKGDFGIAAGDTSVTLAPGFIVEPGVAINFGTGPVLTVASVDYDLNKVSFTTPCSAAISGASPLTFTQTNTIKSTILGINFFDKVYDSSLIVKNRITTTDVSGVSKTIVAQSLITFNNFFDYQPNWANNEFAVVVVRKNDDGYYEKAEVFNVSYDSLARDNSGNNIFVENVFFKMSKYLYAKVGSKSVQRVDTAPVPLPKVLNDAANATIYPQKTEYGKIVYDGYGYTQGDIQNAYTLFADPESFDVNILINHQLDINYASTIAETRKDCIAVVAPFDAQFLSVNSANDCTRFLLDNYGSQTEFDGKQFASFGTYSAVYGNMKYQYDKYNNVNRWINIAGDVAGLYAQTDSTNDPWWAPAGTKRGIIKNVIKLAFNPSVANRDALYVNAINPIMAISGQGQGVVWGQKTATATPSAMDRVNVRRLLVFLEKSIATASNVGLFEFNDKFTRTRLFNIIDPFLRSVQNRRGLYSYKIVVDESNNTPFVIDQNGLVIDIYLQPTKVSEFIRINAIVVPTGASFSEYVGSF